MYGTVAHIRVKAGEDDAVITLMEQWNTERKPKVPGVVAGYMFKQDSDPQDWILVAVFTDKAAYRANADNPEQDRWFRSLMEHLEGEPQWHDGEVFET